VHVEFYVISKIVSSVTHTCWKGKVQYYRLQRRKVRFWFTPHQKSGAEKLIFFMFWSMRIPQFHLNFLYRILWHPLLQEGIDQLSWNFNMMVTWLVLEISFIIITNFFIFHAISFVHIRQVFSVFFYFKEKSVCFRSLRERFFHLCPSTPNRDSISIFEDYLFEPNSFAPTVQKKEYKSYKNVTAS